MDVVYLARYSLFNCVHFALWYIHNDAKIIYNNTRWNTEWHTLWYPKVNIAIHNVRQRQYQTTILNMYTQCTQCMAILWSLLHEITHKSNIQNIQTKYTTIKVVIVCWITDDWEQGSRDIVISSSDPPTNIRSGTMMRTKMSWSGFKEGIASLCILEYDQWPNN